MPASGETLQVEGLAQLQRAFQQADRLLQRELRAALRDVAEPVRADAERLAVSSIRRIGVPWSRMRVGVTTHTVYVAPKQRGSRTPRRRRPNLATLLLGRSMMPALEQNEQLVGRRMENMLATVGRKWDSG